MEGEQLQRKLQGAVDTMLQTIEVNKIRPLQKKAYLAMANCFDNKKSTSQQIQSCQENSQRAAQMSQNIIQQEMQVFQGRIQRCGASCEDGIRDENYDMSSQPGVDKAQAHMLKCMGGCVDKHIALLSGIQYKMEQDIDKAAK